MRLLFTLFCFALCSQFGFSQESECPRIYISGPDGIPVPGEPVPYIIRVEPVEKAVGLSFLWNVVTRNGEVGMVRGQGTTQIEVPHTYDNPSVTAKIIGLPTGCDDTAFEVSNVDRVPVAIKLTEAAGVISKLPKSLFENIRQQLAKDNNIQIMIFVSAGKNREVTSRIAMLKTRLSLKESLGNRFKYVSLELDDEIMIVWLVPLGAEFPIH